MPSLPRVSGREAIRALEKLGFVVRRQRGSHVILRRGATGCVVPDHKELKEGTLNGVQGRLPDRPRLMSAHISACHLNGA